MLILLPIALVFSDSSMANLQTVSIIAAFPLAFVIVLIAASFLKDAGRYLREQNKKAGRPASAPHPLYHKGLACFFAPPRGCFKQPFPLRGVRIPPGRAAPF